LTTVQMYSILPVAMETLTRRQAEVLEFLRQYAEEHGYPPTVAEVMKRFSFSSPHAVSCHLDALRRKGFLRREPRTSRGIVLSDRPRMRRVPVLGRVPAGIPVSEEESPEGFLALDASLTGEGDLFALRVKGKSMEGAGIFDGDYVLVRKGARAEHGEIVVACIDGEYTVKRLSVHRNRVELRAEHPDFPPLRADRAAIAGKVVGLYRRFP